MHHYDWEKIKTDHITAIYSRKIAVGDNVTVARLEAKRGATTRMHSHHNEEVIVVLKGKWRFLLPSGDVILTANQMLTIPAGVPHGSEVLEDAVALDLCSPTRYDWLSGEDRFLHSDPEQFLWAV